jgi:DNA invertase Pin-like site-specific DNA recombinase
MRAHPPQPVAIGGLPGLLSGVQGLGEDARGAAAEGQAGRDSLSGGKAMTVLAKSRTDPSGPGESNGENDAADNHEKAEHVGDQSAVEPEESFERVDEHDGRVDPQQARSNHPTDEQIGSRAQPLAGRTRTPHVLTASDPNRETALYLRVSTETQELAGQERDLREECARRGWEVVAVYSEKVSGTGKVERRESERLLADARKPDRPWAHLLVWSLDRFSREERFTKAIDAILDLENLGITFHSLKEPYLDTPTGTAGAFDVRGLLLSVTSLVAGFESRCRSELVRVAMMEIKLGRRPTKSGRPPGRQPLLDAWTVAAVVAGRRQTPPVPYRELAVRLRIPAGTARRAYSLANRGLPAF